MRNALNVLNMHLIFQGIHGILSSKITKSCIFERPVFCMNKLAGNHAEHAKFVLDFGKVMPF